jgi:D-lyxose ketol-isomerase
MKRSTVNRAYREALSCFTLHSWALPPRPRWDITDFGLGDFEHWGLVLVTLCSEPEYCEKLMYARRGQGTPAHMHARKKEDIICRAGMLSLTLWPSRPDPGAAQADFPVRVDTEAAVARAGVPLLLVAGSRVTVEPGMWHAFEPASEECIIGEVSTANDDANDNFFLDPLVGRFPVIEEDEPGVVSLAAG